MSPPARGAASGNEVDALFKLPLGEFTPARNALVADLKKAGRQAEASEAKALTKPSVSAWAVNQLYWRHRGLFDRLLEAGDRMRRAQAANKTGDAAREPANARRETLTALTQIAEGLLLGGNFGATRDMLRRVTTTLDALSSYGSLPDAPRAGRLTDDVQPPGFEALGGVLAGGGKRVARKTATPTRSPRAEPATKPARPDPRAAAAARRAAQHAAKERARLLAATEAAVRDAERTLKVARKEAERAAARRDAAAAKSTAATASVASAESALESARRRLQQLG